MFQQLSDAFTTLTIANYCQIVETLKRFRICHFVFQLGLMSPLLVGRQQMTDASGCVLCPLPDYPNCGVQLPPTTNSGCSSHPQLQTVGNHGLHSTMENGTCQRVSSPEIAQHNVNPYAVDLEKYEPEMDLTDNPHYYDINKLLFDAHLQRNHRRIGLPPS